jgi:hypothetical protein
VRIKEVLIKKMENDVKSNEYDIRAAVVKTLIAEGIKVEDIRIEIPLDTASSNGRADIILLVNNKVGCIELKSGKDQYNEKDLSIQTDRYKRAFDYCITIVDDVHKREKVVKKDGGEWMVSNWRGVDVSYNHQGQSLDFGYKGEFWTIMKYSESYRTCVYDMLNVLWASDVKEIVGKKSATKCKIVNEWRHTKCLNDVRPLVHKALMKRPLNRWELKFWQEYNGKDK